ncbi:four-carbon acid sugar kinase family protein [Inquilinus limosus]|uniref:Type III effector n=1 Tax=Inquilinus limosus TaxID=171674 RepID=A0A211ZM98_9PROT|nr:four-carbon acid sugar kinase family protein [Inquilinus limosus]OWJ66408.1 type III effector [Inquilinus limosus]
MTSLPPGPLVSWYGDDFTGAAAVMEVLTFGGVPSVLFLDVPTPQHLAAFAGYRGIGIAGVARSKDPAWMERHLPPVFEALAGLGAPVAQYKICSTLDSAPHVGSIGKAADLAVPVLGGAWHPFVVAAPAIGRWQCFGNLFAAFDGTAHRLDRHPTMSRHPVTPMGEADVRRHLARQTDKPFGLVDLTALRSGRGEAALEREIAAGAEIVAFDVVDEADLAAVGGLIWRSRGDRLFAIGSQGLEYALLAHWRQAGLIDPPPPAPSAGAVDRVAVVSGSCAPQTAAQIVHALERGFHPIPVDARLAVEEAAWAGEIGRTVEAALAAIGAGRDPLLFTARGPDDPAVAALNQALAASGADPAVVNERIGTGLGTALQQVLRRGRLKRGIIAGGDTSGYGASVLGIHALTALAPTVPGAALFRAHGDDPALAGLEIALKGGQMGAPDYFIRIRSGGGAASPF